MNTKAAGTMIHFGLSVTGMQKYMASWEVQTSQCKNIEKEKNKKEKQEKKLLKILSKYNWIGADIM